MIRANEGRCGMTEPVTQPTIGRVWIADGCIVCNLCEETCPEVFEVNEKTCVVRASAPHYYQGASARIAQAAEECPVEVIRVAGVNEPEGA